MLFTPRRPAKAEFSKYGYFYNAFLSKANHQLEGILTETGKQHEMSDKNKQKPSIEEHFRAFLCSTEYR